MKNSKITLGTAYSLEDYKIILKDNTFTIIPKEMDSDFIKVEIEATHKEPWDGGYNIHRDYRIFKCPNEDYKDFKKNLLDSWKETPYENFLKESFNPTGGYISFDKEGDDPGEMHMVEIRISKCFPEKENVSRQNPINAIRKAIYEYIICDNRYYWEDYEDEEEEDEDDDFEDFCENCWNVEGD